MKAKLIFIGKNQKNQNDQLQKIEFFNSNNPQYFFAKILGIRPWVSRIDWCKGQRWGSTYIVVRLSAVKSKTDKKCIFARFRPYIRQPDDHILRIDGVEKLSFFESVISIYFSKWKSAWLSYEVLFISAPWMVSSESRKRLHSK